jgi:Ca2+-binding EF-hand superfamily protein
MKKLLVALTGLACMAALTLNAAESKEKHNLTDEQKSVQKELLGKYDTNKDGKLDKEERAKMTKADKEKLQKAGLGHKAKKEQS